MGKNDMMKRLKAYAECLSNVSKKKEKQGSADSAVGGSR